MTQFTAAVTFEADSATEATATVATWQLSDGAVVINIVSPPEMVEVPPEFAAESHPDGG